MITRLQFTIEINAAKAAIWKALWDENMYRHWVSVFLEGSYAITDNWKEGSTVQFLAPDKSGIYSIIEKHIPSQIIQFKHIGTVINGENQPLDDATRKWSGTTETYTLSEENHIHTLTVDIDVLEEHLEFMSKTFPKALEIVKRNSEK